MFECYFYRNYNRYYASRMCLDNYLNWGVKVKYVPNKENVTECYVIRRWFLQSRTNWSILHDTFYGLRIKV